MSYEKYLSKVNYDYVISKLNQISCKNNIIDGSINNIFKFKSFDEIYYSTIDIDLGLIYRINSTFIDQSNHLTKENVKLELLVSSDLSNIILCKFI
jgi:hypothetical protein